MQTVRVFSVASIAFDAPHVVLDGNVLRVVSRVTDDDRDIARSPTRNAFRAIAQSWMDEVARGDRGDFNQALMELGATVCTPRSPKCLLCPLSKGCLSVRRGTQAERPVKTAKEKLQVVQLSVAIVRRGGSVLMRRRPHGERIMPGFWELPQAEGPPARLTELGLTPGEKAGDFRHGITFRSFRGAVYEAVVESAKPEGFRWITRGRRGVLPLTTITKKALAVHERNSGL